MKLPGAERLRSDVLIQVLLKRKKSFIIPATLFFLSFYFTLPVLTSFYPEIVNVIIWRGISLAWMLAFAQFVMTGLIVVLYIWKAHRYDTLVEKIRMERLREYEDSISGGEKVNT
ncbi:DUF485 domain-containing protein [Ferviditalea candida]|uniref:DUF485 domain-containing protein n=1 Tax=Ferviditalea candida TaxID=3108399 RepID=A0ABU5ZGF9_9BACL|nr:DUF485 domain-containing protein [Paenibacillaceae bacterium T2]